MYVNAFTVPFRKNYAVTFRKKMYTSIDQMQQDLDQGYDTTMESGHTQVNTGVEFTDNKIEKDLLFDMISSLLNDEDFSEELKLRIITALEEPGVE